MLTGVLAVVVLVGLVVVVVRLIARPLHHGGEWQGDDREV